MASSRPKRERRYSPESGLEPHFHVTDATFELSPDGTILVSAYDERRQELRLQFTVQVTAANLITMAKQAIHVAADAHNFAMWAEMVERDGSH